MKFIKPILIIAIGGAFVMLANYTWVKSNIMTHGFASYYTSSKILASGGDIASTYDTAYFYSRMHEYGFGSIKDLANLPTGSLMFLPYTVFEPVKAKKMWNASSIIFLVFSLVFLLNAFEIKLNSNTSLILILITLLYYPLYFNMIYGQAYALLLLLASISVYGFSRKYDYLTGFSIALLILFKGYGLFPLVALLLLKRKKTFIITVSITVGLFLLTLPLFGINAWKLFYSNIFPFVSFSKYTSTVAYQTFNSLFGHLFSYNSDTNPSALAQIPQKYIYYFLLAAGLGMLYIFSRKSPKNPHHELLPGIVNFEIIIFTASFAFNVIFAPVAEDHHSLLYLPLLLLILSLQSGGFLKTGVKSFVTVFTVLLLCLPLPFGALQKSAFPVYILAYPRLYGAVLLILIAYSFLNSTASKNKLSLSSI